MKIIKLTLLFFILSNVLQAQKQNPPFWSDIQAFKKQDDIQPPPQHAILFVGSSSFTKWTDVQHYFPAYTIINRGFGGSSLPDLIRYEKDVIIKYHPRQIVIYCGENDIAASDTVTAQLVLERFKKLFSDIRKNLPGVPVIYISMKPSPSRWHLHEKMMEGNKLIEDFLKKQKSTVFISIWKDMLGPDGKPNDDLFIADKLHMNAKGYVIWQQHLKHYLLADLKK
jgi:lysophospholipase L1-like esterase